MGNKNITKKLQIIFYCTIIFILYFGLSNRGQATDAEPFAELSKISEVMDKQDIEMTNWTLYSSEHLNNWETSNTYLNELASIQNKTSEFNWGPELTNNHNGQKKTIATFTHPGQGITETLTYIVFPQNDKFHSYLIYQVQGERFSKDMNQAFSPIVLSRLEDLFLADIEIFTGATGSGSSKLNFGLQQLAEGILDQFSAQKIEFLKEETFISVSAYTNIWNNAIVTNNKKMNLQVAIRQSQQLGGNTTVTIGTPIITTEY